MQAPIEPPKQAVSAAQQREQNKNTIKKTRDGVCQPLTAREEMKERKEGANAYNTEIMIYV